MCDSRSAKVRETARHAGRSVFLMHSGLMISVWMAVVAALQFFSFEWLLGALGGCGLAAFWFAPSRSMRLVRRVRFLVLAIFVLFAGFTPGEAIFLTLPAVSPSREGVMLAVEHVARLLSVVLCVALLLERLPVNRLVGGLYALLRPFNVVGAPRERLAVRLMLVLQYVEAAPSGAWRHWLENQADVEDLASKHLIIEREGFSRHDGELLLVLAILVVLWFGAGR